MSELTPQPQPQILEITPDQHATLANMEVFDAQRAVIELAGRVILSKEVYGAVVEPGDSGTDQVSKIVLLGGHDIGTTINQAGNADGHHPTTKDAASYLDAQKNLPQFVEETGVTEPTPAEQPSDIVSITLPEAQVISESSPVITEQQGHIIAELRADLGIQGEDVSDVLAELKTLHNSLEVNQDIATLEDTWTDLSGVLFRSLDAGNIGQAQHDLSDFAGKLRIFKDMVDNKIASTLPKDVVGRFEDISWQVANIASAATGEYAAVETNVIHTIRERLLQNNQVGEYLRVAAQLRGRIEEAMIGLGLPIEQAQAEKAQTYASQYVHEVAGLLKQNASPDRIEQAISGMRRYIEDNLTGLAALNRIQDNGKKNREGGAYRDTEIYSRDYVAEIAVDMLSGNFDVEAANIGPIRVYTNGNISGQHRAAALMVLYGDKWQEKARDMGMVVEHAGG